MMKKEISSMKWAFIYTLDDPADEMRIDTIGTLTCVGLPASKPRRRLHGNWSAMA